MKKCRINESINVQERKKMELSEIKRNIANYSEKLEQLRGSL